MPCSIFFLSTCEGRDSTANKCPRVCCWLTLQIAVSCQVDLTDKCMTFETCGSNPKRFCWKTRLNYGWLRRITSISYCKGDEGTEKVEAVWQVTLAFMLSTPRMCRITAEAEWKHTDLNKLLSHKFRISLSLTCVQGGCHRRASRKKPLSKQQV